MKSFLKKHTDLSIPENIVYLCCVAPFLHFYLTSLVLLVIGIYVLIKKGKEEIFCHYGSVLVPVFAGLTIVTAICYQNFLGVLASVVFFIIFIIGLYLRSVMTKELFEKALNVICLASVPASFLIITEKLIFIKSTTHRCFGDFFNNIFTSFYLNPNYLASIMAAVVIICAYKVILKKGKKVHYYGIAALSAVTMYLGGSMFIWIEIFVALSIFLFLVHHRQLLGLLLITVAFGCVILYCVPEIFPRLSETNITSDNRIVIWDLAVQTVPKSLWFGRGFFTYFLVSNATPEAYITTHAHNIFLEPILSFGIIGTLILGLFFFIYFQKLIICKNLLHKSFISTLILSLTAGILIHAITDMTMLWIQTALLYSVVFAGMGADEKTIINILHRQAQNRTN